MVSETVQFELVALIYEKGMAAFRIPQQETGDAKHAYVMKPLNLFETFGALLV